jgi:hypothetical protein
MAGKGEEIEMFPRHVDRPFQRADGIADGIVIMQIAPDQSFLRSARQWLPRVGLSARFGMVHTDCLLMLYLCSICVSSVASIKE